MQARRYLWLILLLAFVAVACTGGSGSSGFDAFPSSENAAIDQALTEQRCVDFEGLSVCPADRAVASVPPASATPTPTEHFPTFPIPASPTASPERPTAGMDPTPTPAPAVGVDTTFDASMPQVCRPATTGAGACNFVLAFAPQGLPLVATFRVAVRRDAAGSWRIGAEPESRGSPAAPSFDAVVSIETPAATSESLHVQIAVLVFIEPPVSVPTEVDALVQSGADFAFVTPLFIILQPN